MPLKGERGKARCWDCSVERAPQTDHQTDPQPRGDGGAIQGTPHLLYVSLMCASRPPLPIGHSPEGLFATLEGGVLRYLFFLSVTKKECQTIFS